MNISFLEIATPEELAAYLGHTRRSLDYLLYVLAEENRYKEFTIKKRKGGSRIIHAPNGAYRKLQAKIKASLEEVYSPKSAVHGYVQKRGIKTNAKQHVRKKWVGKIDLENFFPSVNFGRVLGMFKSAPFNFSNDVAKRLAIICTYKGSTPQGALTSPIISNIICSRLDKELTRLCKQTKVTYTRYADDLIFSTNQNDFPEEIIKLKEGKSIAGDEIEKIINLNGFKVNASKTSLISSKSRQMVTGVVVNRKTNVTKQYVRQLKGILHAWEKYGKEQVELRFFEKYDFRNRVSSEHHRLSFEDVIRGKILHIAAMKTWKDPVFVNLAKRFQNLSDRFEVDKIRSYHEAQLRIKLFVEGKSDLLHLESAYEEFFRLNGFQDLIIDFEESIPLGGDKKLFEKLDVNKGIKQQTLTICIFDRDIDNGMAGQVADQRGYVKWAEGMYSALLPLPLVYSCKPFEICIESYYSNTDLKRRSEVGRRIYTRDEFDAFGKCLATPYLKYKTPMKKSYIIDQSVMASVYEAGNLKEVNVALSKVDFALFVRKKETNFENIDFSGFRPVFELIRTIQNDFLR